MSKPGHNVKSCMYNAGCFRGRTAQVNGEIKKALLIYAERLAGQTLLSDSGCHLGQAACQASLQQLTP